MVTPLACLPVVYLARLQQAGGGHVAPPLAAARLGAGPTRQSILVKR